MNDHPQIHIPEVPEIYVSTDVETDGPIPGDFSMLSIGSVAYDHKNNNERQIGSFYCNLKPLEGATRDPHTMEWWTQHPEAWKQTQQDPQDPEEAMQKYLKWVRSLTYRIDDKNKGVSVPVFVGYPASFDFMFVYWYLKHFTGRSPFGFQALDIKTYAMAALGRKYKSISKRTMPKRWFSNLPHTHIALDDAAEQGKIFFNIKREIEGNKKDTSETASV